MNNKDSFILDATIMASLFKNLPCIFSIATGTFGLNRFSIPVLQLTFFRTKCAFPVSIFYSKWRYHERFTTFLTCSRDWFSHSFMSAFSRTKLLGSLGISFCYKFYRALRAFISNIRFCLPNIRTFPTTSEDSVRLANPNGKFLKTDGTGFYHFFHTTMSIAWLRLNGYKKR